MLEVGDLSIASGGCLVSVSMTRSVEEANESTLASPEPEASSESAVSSSVIVSCRGNSPVCVL